MTSRLRLLLLGGLMLIAPALLLASVEIELEDTGEFAIHANRLVGDFTLRDEVTAVLPPTHTGTCASAKFVNALNADGTITCASSANGWVDDGTIVRLETSTDNVSIGTASNFGKLGVDGDTNERQLRVQGFDTQTNEIALFEKSDGEDFFAVKQTSTGFGVVLAGINPFTTQLQRGVLSAERAYTGVSSGTSSGFDGTTAFSSRYKWTPSTTPISSNTLSANDFDVEIAGALGNEIGGTTQILDAMNVTMTHSATSGTESIGRFTGLDLTVNSTGTGLIDQIYGLRISTTRQGNGSGDDNVDDLFGVHILTPSALAGSEVTDVVMIDINGSNSVATHASLNIYSGVGAGVDMWAYGPDAGDTVYTVGSSNFFLQPAVFGGRGDDVDTSGNTGNCPTITAAEYAAVLIVPCHSIAGSGTVTEHLAFYSGAYDKGWTGDNAAPPTYALSRHNVFMAPTERGRLNATNASAVVTEAVTVSMEGPPIAGAAMTITYPYILELGGTTAGMTRMAPMASAPAACQIGDLYFDTSGAFCACTAANTWTNTTGVGTCA